MIRHRLGTKCNDTHMSLSADSGGLVHPQGLQGGRKNMKWFYCACALCSNNPCEIYSSLRSLFITYDSNLPICWTSCSNIHNYWRFSCELRICRVRWTLHNGQRRNKDRIRADRVENLVEYFNAFSSYNVVTVRLNSVFNYRYWLDE